MWKVLEALNAIHIIFILIAAVSFFSFWIRTRFWFPRYVHYLAVIALLLAITTVITTDPEAPINQGEWAWLKRAAITLAIPGTVYFVFVFYGGQRAAYDGRHVKKPCPYCGARRSTNPGALCPNCGQSGDV